MSFGSSGRSPAFGRNLGSRQIARLSLYPYEGPLEIISRFEPLERLAAVGRSLIATPQKVIFKAARRSRGLVRTVAFR